MINENMVYQFDGVGRMGGNIENATLAKAIYRYVVYNGLNFMKKCVYLKERNACDKQNNTDE